MPPDRAALMASPGAGSGTILVRVPLPIGALANGRALSYLPTNAQLPSWPNCSPRPGAARTCGAQSTRNAGPGPFDHPTGTNCDTFPVDRGHGAELVIPEPASTGSKVLRDSQRASLQQPTRPMLAFKLKTCAEYACEDLLTPEWCRRRASACRCFHFAGTVPGAASGSILRQLGIDTLKD